MLRVILLVATFLGLTSSAFAAQPSLFGDFFGKTTVTKAALTMAPKRVTSIDGPISIVIDISTQEINDANTLFQLFCREKRASERRLSYRA